MVKECTEQDRAALMAYLKQEPVYNTFMLADIEDFGFNEKFQTVYMDVEQGECLGVYLCFYNSLILYSKDGNMNIPFLEQLFSWYIPDVVMGKIENVRMVQRVLPDYHIEARGLYLFKDADCLVQENPEIRQASGEDIDDIFAFLQSIPELRSLYRSKQMIADRIHNNNGIHCLIRENGKIIAHANSTAECEETVMIGGVAVAPGYRGRGLASQIVSALCRQILAKEKRPCLFCSQEEAHNLYYNIGFRRAGDWGTLTELPAQQPEEEEIKKEESQKENVRAEKSETKVRLPSYIPVYNQLYSDIISGVYEKGSMLPSETVLAEKYCVSRNTLRQALTILTQDGHIYKHQGKGTYVSYDKDKKSKEKIYNFLLEDALEDIVHISMDFNIGQPTQIARQKLGLSEGEEVLASNNVYKSEDGPIGQSFLQIPVSILEESGVDMESQEDLLEFMDWNIYRKAVEADVSIQIVEADEQVIPYLEVEEGTSLLHIEQVLYDWENRAIGRIKYYFRSGKYQIQYRL
ncbi:MAG: GNAT family N-acetyltransferase [Muricomes sp.]